MKFSKKFVAAATVVALVSGAGIADATYDSYVRERASGPNPAVLKCPGGMSRLGHEFNENMTIFAGDPAIHISDEYTVAEDFFLVEDIDTGSHAGTHLDAPGHFIEGGRTVDELRADEFVWPAYKIDVRDMEFVDGLVQKSDIRDYEREHGRIKTGSLVILQTGAEQFWGAETVANDTDDNSTNIDDFFDFENPGFSGDAINWLFSARKIDGVGSDAYGPDAYSDGDFLATYNTLFNDGVALVAIKNLDSVSVRGDLIMAPTIALSDGSGFTTDPIACHGGSDNHYGGEDEDDRDD